MKDRRIVTKIWRGETGGGVIKEHKGYLFLGTIQYLVCRDGYMKLNK